MSERKPLTLEELRKMELKPVWLITYSGKNKIPRISQWALVASASNYSVSFVRVAVSGRMEKKCGDYGKTWLAYAYEPPHLDRSAWEPCENCESCDNCEYAMFDGCEYPCNDCVTECKESYPVSFFKAVGYCKHCGRPLTDAAWDMLGKRLENAK